MVKEGTENVLKYKLTLAIKRMWCVKIKVIPVITGTIPKSLRQYLNNSGKARYQGTAENGHTGHRARITESTNVKLQNVCHWNVYYTYQKYI